MRLVLLPLAVPAALFRLGVSARNAVYDRGWRRPSTVDGLRVVSIGNLTVGGAGKTPVAIALAQRLAARGERVAVLSRGYGRLDREMRRVRGPPWPEADAVGDEPLLIAQRCPEATVFVGGDRRVLAQAARESGARVALLDDGFQLRGLARDLDILVVDAAVGFGSGHLLPWGPLREPAASLERAGLIWIRTTEGEERLPRLPAGLPVVRARHGPVSLVDERGVEQPCAALAEYPVLAFCGIARPSSFGDTVRRLGPVCVALRSFPDHHRYTPTELADLSAHARNEKAVLLTTEKDRVRCPRGFETWSVRLGVELLSGADRLDALLGAR